MAGLLERAFTLERLHHLAIEEAHATRRLRVELRADAREENIFVDRKPGVVDHRLEDDARLGLRARDLRNAENAPRHLVGHRHEIL